MLISACARAALVAGLIADEDAELEEEGVWESCSALEFCMVVDSRPSWWREVNWGIAVLWVVCVGYAWMAAFGFGWGLVEESAW